MTAWRSSDRFHSSPMKGHMASQKARGFTLIEAMITVSVLLIAGAITFASLAPAMLAARVNTGYNTTMMMLRLARQMSVDNRKTYIVNFIAPSTIQLQQVDAGVVGAVLRTATLPQDVQFLNVSGIPTNNALTPDNMGTGGKAIEFDIGVAGGVNTQIWFFPDGSARDINNNINNGVVYVARLNDLYSSRAVTMFGAAGRVRGWRLYPPAVAGTPVWKQQ
jgi:prepilin-type N-terminal cleavage/methylation domain-containing protein